MLDIHGVLDSQPQKFVMLACETLCQIGNEVHIVTGETISKKLIQQLLSYNNDEKYWTHLVSIQDELIQGNVPTLGINNFGRPTFPEDIWNSFKGRYCAEHKIDFAIDDSPEYEAYFDPKITIFFLNKKAPK